MVKSGLQSMTVNGVKKISLWKYSESREEWEECPNLPASFIDVYLERGFRKSPPEAKPEPQVEEKTGTFSEAIASGKLDNVVPVSTSNVRVKKKLGRPKKV